MYHKILNSLFASTVSWSKCHATKVADQYISKVGVERFLNAELDKNENARLEAFEGIAGKALSQNKLDAALAELTAAFKSGQIDSGNYHTQKYKIEMIAKANKVSELNEYMSHTDEYANDKIRHAGYIGDEMAKSISNYNKSKQIEEKGVLETFVAKVPKERSSDRKLH